MLDAACGTYIFIVTFSRIFPSSEIGAVDFLSESITVARKKLYERKNGSLYIAGLIKLLRLKNKYDLIYYRGVSHHVPGHHKALITYAHF